MKIVIDNHHLDHSGGGEHVRMIISLLSNFSEIYVTRKPSFYSGNNFTTTPLKNPVKQYKYNFTPDLFIYISYRGESKGIGKVNAQLCFYAIKKDIKNYEHAICINNFVANSVKNNWGINPVIIPPFFDFETYNIQPKEKSLINIGNFFMENDGHSKNQHILMEWFIDNKLEKDGWKFNFFGFLNNDEYFKKLKSISSKSNGIHLHPNADRATMLAYLSSAKFMIHAMGYGRSDPAQTEHFGLVAVQSLLSGCRPIVHKSGGCKDIQGTLSYSNTNEILDIITSDDSTPDQLRSLGKIYSYESSLRATEIFIEQIVNKSSSIPTSAEHLKSRFHHLIKSIR